MQRKPGKSVLKSAERIRQAAVTCDFTAIKDSLAEALRTRFICSINNEAVLKAQFQVKNDKLNFPRAVEIAVETEVAAKVSKKTAYGSKPQRSPFVKSVLINLEKWQLQTARILADLRSKCFRCVETNHNNLQQAWKLTLLPTELLRFPTRGCHQEKRYKSDRRTWYSHSS